MRRFVFDSLLFILIGNRLSIMLIEEKYFQTIIFSCITFFLIFGQAMEKFKNKG